MKRSHTHTEHHPPLSSPVPSFFFSLPPSRTCALLVLPFPVFVTSLPSIHMRNGRNTDRRYCKHMDIIILSSPARACLGISGPPWLHSLSGLKQPLSSRLSLWSVIAFPLSYFGSSFHLPFKCYYVHVILSRQWIQSFIVCYCMYDAFLGRCLSSAICFWAITRMLSLQLLSSAASSLSKLQELFSWSLEKRLWKTCLKICILLALSVFWPVCVRVCVWDCSRVLKIFSMLPTFI